jgi:hypothetical protein
LLKNRCVNHRWWGQRAAISALIIFFLSGPCWAVIPLLAQHARPRFAEPVAAQAPLSPVDQQRVARILAKLNGVSPLPARLAQASRELLGAPYQSSPLRGSVDQPEELVTRTDGFDCVTFLETVLALGLSSQPNQFVDTLRTLRYQDGRIDFRARHHYMTDWHRANRSLGLLQELIPLAEVKEEARTLSIIEGLPYRRVTLRYLPRSRIPRLTPQIEDGDLIYFLTSRQGIDAFHTGLLFWVDGQLRLRHASRRRGQVIEEDLSGFLRHSPPAGVILLRPLPLPTGSAMP